MIPGLCPLQVSHSWLVCDLDVGSQDPFKFAIIDNFDHKISRRPDDRSLEIDILVISASASMPCAVQFWCEDLGSQLHPEHSEVIGTSD